MVQRSNFTDFLVLFIEVKDLVLVLVLVLGLDLDFDWNVVGIIYPPFICVLFT